MAWPFAAPRPCAAFPRFAARSRTGHAGGRVIDGRLAGRRVAGVIGRWLDRAVGGGRDIGQRAQQQAHEDLRAQQVDAAPGTGGVQRPSQRTDPRHRRRGAHAGQAVARQRGGPVLIRKQADPGAALGFFAPTF